MADEEDTLLVEHWSGGDKRAFETLFEKYQKPMFNVALRMTKSYSDAEDITQAAFLKAYQNLSTFDPRYRFFSWMYRITVNESLNFVNQRKQVEELSEEIRSDEKSAEESFDENQTARNVQDALMQLKPDHRAVVVLKHLQGLSYSEIGEILGIPEKKVKSRLFTARLMLKDVLVARGLKEND